MHNFFHKKNKILFIRNIIIIIRWMIFYWNNKNNKKLSLKIFSIDNWLPNSIKNKSPLQSKRIFLLMERPPLHLSQLQDRPFQDFRARCIPTSLERLHSLICIFGIVVITQFIVRGGMRWKSTIKERRDERGKRERERIV